MSGFDSSLRGQTFFYSYHSRVNLKSFRAGQRASEFQLPHLFEASRSLFRKVFLGKKTEQVAVGQFRMLLAGCSFDFGHSQPLNIGSKPGANGLPINTKMLLKKGVIDRGTAVLEDNQLTIDYTGQKPHATVLGFEPVLVMREREAGAITIYALCRVDATSPRFDNRAAFFVLEGEKEASDQFVLHSYNIPKFRTGGVRNFKLEIVEQTLEDKFELQPNDLLYMRVGSRSGLPVYISGDFQPQASTEAPALPPAISPPLPQPLPPAPADVNGLGPLLPAKLDITELEIIRLQKEYGYRSFYEMLPDEGKRWCLGRGILPVYNSDDVNFESAALRWLVNKEKAKPGSVGAMLKEAQLAAALAAPTRDYKDVLGVLREKCLDLFFDPNGPDNAKIISREEIAADQAFIKGNRAPVFSTPLTAQEVLTRLPIEYFSDGKALPERFMTEAQKAEIKTKALAEFETWEKQNPVDACFTYEMDAHGVMRSRSRDRAIARFEEKVAWQWLREQVEGAIARIESFRSGRDYLSLARQRLSGEAVAAIHAKHQKITGPKYSEAIAKDAFFYVVRDELEKMKIAAEASFETAATIVDEFPWQKRLYFYHEEVLLAELRAQYGFESYYDMLPDEGRAWVFKNVVIDCNTPTTREDFAKQWLIIYEEQTPGALAKLFSQG